MREEGCCFFTSEKLHREIRPRLVRDANGRIQKHATIFLPGIEHVAPLHGPQRHRIVRLHGDAHRRAGIRRKAAGHVHGNHRPRRFIHEADHGRLLAFHIAGKAGADERIHQDVRFVNVGNPIHRLLDGNDRDVHFLYHGPIALAGLAHVRFIAHEEHHHLRALCRCVPSDDEAITAIISCAADDDCESAVPGHLPIRQRHHRSAGIFHEHHLRKTPVLHGPLVQAS